MAFRALTLGEISELQSILTAGISSMTYNMVANYLVPRGFGWAQATGFARNLVPEFNSLDFAEQWYKPYQVNKQHTEAVKRGLDILIPEKDFIETPLKQATRYMYNVSFDILDEDGNVVDTGKASYYSDELLTPEDIAYRAESVFDTPSESVPLGAANYEFEAVYHNEGWNY